MGRGDDTSSKAKRAENLKGKNPSKPSALTSFRRGGGRGQKGERGVWGEKKLRQKQKKRKRKGRGGIFPFLAEGESTGHRTGREGGCLGIKGEKEKHEEEIAREKNDLSIKLEEGHSHGKVGLGGDETWGRAAISKQTGQGKDRDPMDF